MTYQLQLTNGQIFNLTDVKNFDADTFAAILNARDSLFISIAGSVINKQTILAIVPLDSIPSEPKV